MKHISLLLSILVFALVCAACQPASTIIPPSPDSPTATGTPPPAPTTASPTSKPVIPPPAQPSPSQKPTGLLAFYSDRDGNPEIYVMNADGSGLARLTSDPSFDDSPALSPDGSQIAFLTARHDPNPQFPNLKYELYVMNVDGSDPRRLTNTAAAEGHPAWSPDGSRISFDADYDGDGFYEIYTILPDGSNLERLTSGANNDQFADWSPDGRQIAFASDRGGNWDIYVMDAGGANPHAVTSSPNWELFPAWSPDGSRIAFNGLIPRSQNTDIFLVNADGSVQIQLTDSPGFDENPTWSPDGSQIAFQTRRDGNFELYIMNPDGSGQHPLVVYPADELWPSWISSTPLVLQKSSQQAGGRENFQAALGDLDGDGDLDILFASPQKNNSSVWLNDGKGNLSNTGQELTQYGHGAGLADFDGDGDLDAFVTCHQFIQPSRIYINDGHANFRENGQDLGDTAMSGVEVNLVDINADGHTDVHTAYFNQPDRVYVNDGSAVFSDSGLKLAEEAIAWGDLDGDGDADYFGKRWSKGYGVQINQGGAQGGSSGQFAGGWQMEDSQSTVGGIALADFDGDGDLDALVANGHRQSGSYPTLLFWNDGHGQFTDSGQRFNKTQGAELESTDLDGDGSPDVVVANMDLASEIWLNDGNGSFEDSGLRLDVPAATKPSLGDLNGDGKPDLIIGSLSGKAQIWFNLPPG